MIKMEDTKLKFEIETQDITGTRARVGKVYTSKGSFETPVFMPVGTRAVVKTMTPENLKIAGTKILLGNTYHLAVRPGEKLIEKMGKLHKFMAWDGPILTDSGGFQAFSLADLRKLTDEGVTFKSHINGDLFEFTPKRVVEIQRALGSDIMMPLDHCVGWPCSYKDAKEAAERSVRWLEMSASYKIDPHQSLFGIIQGSGYRDLRKWCAEEMVALNLPGYAIGGLAVGEPKDTMQEMIQEVNEILPQNKPRYLMGVGTPLDLVMSIANGVDMFDCVMPTRNARNGGVFTWSGKLQIRNSCHKESNQPLDSNCNCYCCKTFTRSYLHHLFSKKVQEILGLSMLSLHNITFYHDLTKAVRKAIREGYFKDFYEDFLGRYTK